MTYWEQIRWPGWNGALEILVLAIVFYYIMLFFRGTRGAQVLSGLVLVFVFLIFITNAFNLITLNWILQRFSGFIVIAFIVIFQVEIRRALAELGKQQVFRGGEDSKRSLVGDLVSATEILAEQKIGALIAVERDIATRSVQETGTRMDSLVSAELLASIFFPRTPLHDGGVVISNDRIVAAACVFPLSQREGLSKTLGTRHRAAIGLTEETDAVVIVVSEETGTISVAYKGRLSRGLDAERLRRVLHSVLRGAQDENRWSRARKQLNLTPEAVGKTDALLASKGEEPSG